MNKKLPLIKGSFCYGNKVSSHQHPVPLHYFPLSLLSDCAHSFRLFITGCCWGHFNLIHFINASQYFFIPYAEQRLQVCVALAGVTWWSNSEQACSNMASNCCFKQSVGSTVSTSFVGRHGESTVPLGFLYRTLYKPSTQHCHVVTFRKVAVAAELA